MLYYVFYFHSTGSSRPLTQNFSFLKQQPYTTQLYSDHARETSKAEMYIIHLCTEILLNSGHYFHIIKYGMTRGIVLWEILMITKIDSNYFVNNNREVKNRVYGKRQKRDSRLCFLEKTTTWMRIVQNNSGL